MRTENAEGSDSLVCLHGRSRNHVRSGSSVRGPITFSLALQDRDLNNSRVLFVNDSVGVHGNYKVLVCVMFESTRTLTIRLFLIKRLV